MKNIIPCLFLFFALATIFGCAKLKNASTDTVPIVSNEHIGQPHYNLFEPIAAKTELDAVVKGAVFFKLDTAELQRLYLERPAHFTFQLPATEGLPAKFVFDKKQVTAPSMRLYDQNKMPLMVNEGIHYRQLTQGGSAAGISIFENKLSAIFATADGNFSLSELTASPGEYILFKESMLVEQPEPFTCTPLYAPGYKMPKYEEYNQPNIAKSTASNPNDPVVRVFAECDQDMLAMCGGTAQGVYEYVTSLFNFVSIIYENDGILLQLSEMMVWTANDPFNGSLGDALSTFVQHWQEANMTFNGDLAHLLKGYSGGGLAWVDMVCNPDLPFGVSGIPNSALDNFPNYIYSVYVVAHELGHNVGSPHTHNCSWGPNNDQALDNCASPEGGCDWGPPPANGGTIMSYCGGFNLLNGFGPEPGNLIRTLISQKTCLQNLQYISDCQMDSIEVVLECLPDPTPSEPMDNQFSVRLNVKGNGAPNSLRATDLTSGQTWLFSYNTYLTIGPFKGLEGLRYVRIEDLDDPACTTERAVFPPSDCYRPDLCLQYAWDNMVGGSEEDLIEAIAALPSGGYVSVGRTRSNDGDFTTTLGDWDFFVQKLNEDGNTAWIKTFGGESYDFGYDIVGLADGGALVIGNTNSVTGIGSGNKGSSDAFALRLDANGNEVWKKLYGGSGHDQFFSMVAMPSGDFAFAGQSWSNDGDVSGSFGLGDGWVLRANANGDIIWSHLYGDDADNLYANIALGHGNNFALTGQSSSSNTSPNILPIAAEIAFDGTMNWNKTYNVTQNGNGVGLFPNDNGGYLLLHQNTRPQVARLDAMGNLLETWEVNSPRNSYFVDAIKLSNNRIAVAGHRNGQPGVPGTSAISREFWAYMLDGDGNLLFDRTYGLYRFDEAYAIAPTNQGGYILAGKSETYYESHQLNTWTVKFGPDICTQPGACYITAQVSNIACHDNGTINDLTDDVFTFDLMVSKAGDCGASWTVDSIVSNYGLPVAMGPYPISEGPKTLNIHDYLDATITTNLTVNPPGACSFGISYCTDNLLNNPGFETSWYPLLGWQMEGDVSTSDSPHKGDYAAQICDGTGNITQVLPAVPGSDYTASAWVRKASASTGYSKFTLRFLTSSWQPLLDDGQVFTNTKYEQIVFTKTAPPNAAYVQVLLWKEAGGCVETDDWELCEGTVEPPCEITAVVNGITCSDNSTPANPSDDTYYFYLMVHNSGVGQTYSLYVPETGMTQSGGYNWPYTYGGFEISNGPMTLIFTDNDNSDCTTSVTVTPPPTCSQGDKPDFELSSFIATQSVGGSNPQIHPNDMVVAGTTVYFPDHFAELYFPVQMPTFTVTIGAYLSNDFTLDANDLLLTSGTRTIDAAVQSSGFTEGIFGNNSQIPTTTPAGNYYIIVKYDSENAVDESDESNNMGILPIIVTSGNTGAIDLELSLAQPNANPPIYSNYSVTATLKNMGGQAATGVKVGFAKPAGVVYTGGNEYTASQGSFDPNGTQSWTVGTIPAGGTATLTVNYFLLQASTPVAYAQVTAANEQDSDSTPGNGTPPTPNEDDEASTEAVVTPKPDLVLANLSVDNSPVQSGQVLFYNFDLSNMGNATASGNFSIKTWISTDNVISPDDIQDGVSSASNFPPGYAVYDYSKFVTVPAGFADGTYFIIIKVDADNQITESNEGNNVISATFTVDNGIIVFPELVGYQGEIIPSHLCFAKQGELFGSMEIRVNNVGDISASSFQVKFYLSTDSIFSADDLLWSTYTVPSLGLVSVTGPAFVGPTAVIPPSLPNGKHYVFVTVDEDNEVVEPNETNNNVGPILIQIGAADLVLESFSGAPPSVAQGSVFNIQATVSFEANGFTIPPTSAVTLHAELFNGSYYEPIGTTTFTLGEFNQNNMATKTIVATVPPDFELGVHDIRVIAYGAFCEDVNPNNYQAQLITVTGASGQIDLELSLTQPNPAPSIYSNYAVVATVANKGGQPATGVKVKFAKPVGVVYTGGNEWTATQGSFTPFGPEEWTVGTIPANGSATLTVSYFLLQNGAPNAYAQVIAANEQDMDSAPNNGTPPTPNEDDEAATGGGGPPTQTPDLTISDLQVPNPAVQAGQVLTYHFDVANIGTVAVPGNFTIKSYISTDQVLSANDVQDGTIPTGNFATGFTVQNVPGASTIPANLTNGQYYLIVKIDAEGIVAEGNESNNTVVSPFTVGGPTNPCEAITITPSPGEITITGATAPHVLIKVFRPNWSIAFECLDGACPNPVVVTGLTNGSHYVEVKLMNAYWGEICMEKQYVGVNNMAAPDDARQRISFERVYPNPAKYSVNLEVYSPEDQSAVLDFYDQQGRIIHSLKTELEEGTNNIQVFVFDWKSGTYNVIARGEKTGLPAYMRFLKVWEE